MRFVTIGPGALGCLVSSVLARTISPTEDDLWLLDYNEQRAQLLNQKGIVYEKDNTQDTYMLHVSSSPEEIGNADVIFLCVKSYDVVSSLNFCRPLLQKNTLLIFLQNGISHLDVKENLAEAKGIYATTTEGATRLGAGHIRHAGTGVTYLGFLEQAQTDDMELLRSTCLQLEKGGMKVDVDDDIRSRLWAKLFINVGINPFTAIWNCKNGELLTLPGVKEQMRQAIAEAVRVAEAHGIHIATDPYELALSVCKSTASNVSSMLQDVRAKRLTEIAAINGAVVREGKKTGTATPVNQELVEKINMIEKYED